MTDRATSSWLVVSLIACQRPLLFAPPPPELDGAASVLILAVPNEGEPIRAIFDGKLELEGENERRYTLYALAYGCDAGAVPLEPPYPHPYLAHRIELPDGAWTRLDDLTPIAALVEMQPACPIYTPASVPIPGTENNPFSATVVDFAGAALLVAAEGIFRVDSTGAIEPVPELDGAPRAGAVRTPAGEVVLVGPDRAVRFSAEGELVEMPPMIADPVEAVLASHTSGIVAIVRTASGATSFERFDGAWRLFEDCQPPIYATVPKPTITIADDTVVVMPSEISSLAPARLLPGFLAAIDEFGCHIHNPPNTRISSGTLTELGRVIGAFGANDFDAAAGTEFFIERSESWDRHQLPLDEAGDSRGSIAALAPRPRGFTFGTHHGSIGELIEGTGFCFVDQRPPNLPLEIEPTESGFVVLSKGAYDPTGVHWCEQQGSCLPIHLTFVAREDHPTAACSQPAR